MIQLSAIFLFCASMDTPVRAATATDFAASLKCDNVLTARRGNKLQCKVCDFGLSKQRRSQASFVSGITSHCGTLPWTAPELLSDPGRASEKARGAEGDVSYIRLIRLIRLKRIHLLYDVC